MLVVEDLVVRVSDFELGPVSLAVRPGEYFVLLGPSGAGKTTLLEWVAGFRTAVRGRVRLGGQPITGAPPAERGLGVVYQDSCLFPHLSVADNLSFPLLVRGVTPARVEARVHEIARTVRIEHRLQARPGELSAGEAKRVALGRALAADCKVLLLDEPLEGLDPRLRRDLRLELHGIAAKLGLTVLHITHSLDEALALADRIAVLLDGRVAQTGTPGDLVAHPASLPVARYLMIPNVLTATGFPHRGIIRLPDGTEIPAPVPHDGPVLARFRGGRASTGPEQGVGVRTWVRGVDRRAARATLVLGLTPAPTADEPLLEVVADGARPRRGEPVWLDLRNADWTFT